MGGHDDDGQYSPTPRQFLLELQPIHAGHAKIGENATAWRAQRRCFKEGFSQKQTGHHLEACQ